MTRREFGAVFDESIRSGVGVRWTEVRDRPLLDQTWNDLLDVFIRTGDLPESAGDWVKPWDKRRARRR